MLNQHIEPNISVWSGQNQIWRDRPVSEESQSVLPVGQAWPLLSPCCSQGKAEECRIEGKEGRVLADSQDLSWAVAGLARAGHYCVDQQV